MLLADRDMITKSWPWRKVHSLRASEVVDFGSLPPAHVDILMHCFSMQWCCSTQPWCRPLVMVATDQLHELIRVQSSSTSHTVKKLIPKLITFSAVVHETSSGKQHGIIGLPCCWGKSEHLGKESISRQVSPDLHSVHHKLRLFVAVFFSLFSLTSPRPLCRYKNIIHTKVLKQEHISHHLNVRNGNGNFLLMLCNLKK